MTEHNANVTRQFDLRSGTFSASAHWITDKNLTQAHVDLAGAPRGQGLEMCCGTGEVAKALHQAGWKMTGADISPGMVSEAKRFVPAIVGDVTNLPFEAETFDLIAMRQAYFLLGDGPAALKEVKRLLKPGGVFLLSHLVPFNETDSGYLREVHTVKQAQMREFYTIPLLQKTLKDNGFELQGQREVVVRESVTLWMDQAPELSPARRQQVINMVANAPKFYKDLHDVKIEDGEVTENWNFVLMTATVAK